jgi:hypothetical protein
MSVSVSVCVGACVWVGPQKQKRNLSDFEGIVVLQELDVPDARRILELEGLATGTAACEHMSVIKRERERERERERRGRHHGR